MKEYKLYKKCNISWLDSIPDHWKTKPAKRLFTLLSRPVGPQDEIITCFRDGVVTLRKNRRETGFTESLKETGYQGIKKGDLVIHQMDAFAGSVGVSDSDGKSTPVYSVCAPKEKLSPYYYAYIIREMARSNYILALAKGIRQRSTDFRFSTFAQCILPVPPVGEQDIIVAYLDKKCAEIDELISRRHAIIERLKELKQSIIVSAVTRGLDPDVPMKDSGIPWLGGIPTHWALLPLSELFSEVKNRNIELKESNLLSLSFGSIKRKAIDSTFGLLPKSFKDYNIISEEDIVLRLTDLQNDQKSFRTGIAFEKGIITSAYTAIRLKKKGIATFLHFALHAFDVCKGFYSLGSGVRQSLNWNGVKKVILPVPPLSEQESIVAYLDKKCGEIDELVSRQELIIEKLKELKVSTIAHVVTGKVDVRDAI